MILAFLDLTKVQFHRLSDRNKGLRLTQKKTPPPTTTKKVLAGMHRQFPRFGDSDDKKNTMNTFIKAGPGRCEEGEGGGFLNKSGPGGRVSPWLDARATPLFGGGGGKGEFPQTLQNSSICEINLWPLLASYKLLVLLSV